MEAQDIALGTEEAAETGACPFCKGTHTEPDAEVLRGLRAAPGKLGRLLRGLAAGDWGRSYGPGRWTIRQIVCHLRDAEMVIGTRFRKMIAEDGGELTPFDQDLWAERTAYARQDGRAAFEVLRHLRAANLELLRLAGPGARACRGRHPEYGTITVAQLARHLLHHDRGHMDQIASARPAARREAPPARRRAARSAGGRPARRRTGRK